MSTGALHSGRNSSDKMAECIGYLQTLLPWFQKSVFIQRASSDHLSVMSTSLQQTEEEWASTNSLAHWQRRPRLVEDCRRSSIAAWVGVKDGNRHIQYEGW